MNAYTKDKEKMRGKDVNIQLHMTEISQTQVTLRNEEKTENKVRKRERETDRERTYEIVHKKILN